MSDRRYGDKEVDAIFRAAASDRSIEPAHPQSGLTLAELQQVGLEAGFSAESVALAAAALDLESTTSFRRTLGLPIGVSHTVELGRTLADDEWDQLVSRMRDVFDAHGKTGVDGNARFWRNGNLRVLLEPSGAGHRLRFRTTNDTAQVFIVIGGLLLAIVLVGAMATLFKGTLPRAAGGLIPIGIMGLASTLTGALRLPKWARTRASQMELLGQEAAAAKTLPRPSGGEIPT